MSTSASPGLDWADSPHHHGWLTTEAHRLLAFYQYAAADTEHGGFWWLGDDGRPLTHRGKQLWINARMIHTFAIGALLGRPGCAPLVELGLHYLQHGPLRDRVHGGWIWAVDQQDNATDSSKQNYGHAFVLLAACSAAHAGFDTATLLEDVVQIIDRYFWRDADGLCVDTYNRTWTECEAYRGQNSNMHMVEAFLAAAEATGEQRFVDRAVRVAERLIRQLTASNDWRLAEHYDASWTIARDYNRDQPNNLFRPYGSIIGHWLEWARLLLQLRAVAGERAAWALDAARTLFQRAIAEGWDADRSGFFFTVDWSGSALNRDRYHWVTAEAIGAAVYLYRTTGDEEYARWYRAFWDYADQYVVDHERGSWWHQLDPTNQPTHDPWEGKPDLYHALQATLFARTPVNRGIALALASGQAR